MGFYKELGDRLEKWLKEKIKVVDTKVESITKYHKYVNTELDYCYLRPDITVGNIAISEGFIIPFIVHNGNMEYNPENYSVKLKGGKTYKIEADMYVFSEANYVNYILYDITNNVELYYGTKISVSLNNTSSSDLLTYIYTPENDCEIQIKISTPSKSMKISADKAYFSVQEINRQITIDPVEHVNNSQGIEDTPVGHIIAHMGTIAPKHYLICDGTEYNIEDYPYLAQHIEDNFGSISYFGGDGETTFAVPDLRGEFLRGTGTNSHENQGSGAEVGEHQDASARTRIVTDANGRLVIDYLGQSFASTIANADSSYQVGTTSDWQRRYNSSASDTGKATLFTSRPTNTSVLYCIKYEPTYFMNTYNTNYMQPSLYSEEERLVGCWINGKPLYEKVFYNLSYTAYSGTWTKLFSVADLNIDETICINGKRNKVEGFMPQLQFDTYGGTLSVAAISGSHPVFAIVMQYTKTTDEENSFTNDMLKDSYVELTYSDEEISTMVSDILGGEE